MEVRVERIRMVRGKDEFLVAQRGVAKLLNEGWTYAGANRDPQESQVPEGNPIDSGSIVVKPIRKRK